MCNSGEFKLGYAEFGEIQRTLRYGVGNQRRAMGNNVYLASLAQRFSEARDPEIPALDANELHKDGLAIVKRAGTR